MKEFNMTGLRESLEKLPTPQLDAMLRAELEKEPPDEHAVRLILKVLREREKDYPIESNERINKAWEKFQEDTEPTKPRTLNTFLRVASVVIVVGILLLTLPQEANAKSFFDRIAAWTDSIFELFSPSDSGRQQPEYVFQTDHPGLQEVYDTVTELGITDPVVPMWLPEGYELVECKALSIPSKVYTTATFYNGISTAVIQIDFYSDNVSSEYTKNDSTIQQHEKNGIIHNIMKNKDLWAVVWTKDKLECSIHIDCQESDLYRIIDSIYTVGG